MENTRVTKGPGSEQARLLYGKFRMGCPPGTDGFWNSICSHQQWLPHKLRLRGLVLKSLGFCPQSKQVLLPELFP